MKNRIEKERSFWDSFAKKYDGFIQKNASSTYEKLLTKLLKDTKETEKLLEIATGTGIISIRLSEQIPAITAIDIAPKMIEIAISKRNAEQISNIDFRVGDSNKLDFEDESFDTIIASNVLHLLFEPKKAIQEMVRVLKINGQIIIPTYCHGANFKSQLLSRLMGLFGFSARSRWSVKSFKDFISNLGLEIIETEVYADKIPLVYLRAKKTDMK